MRSRKATLDKFGYICQTMIRDIKAFNVSSAYAYNSPFDDKIFSINTDWYKCANPFDNIPIFDIRGYAINYIVNNDYKAFCDKNIKNLRQDREFLLAQYLSREFNIQDRDFITKLQHIDNRIKYYEDIKHSAI